MPVPFRNAPKKRPTSDAEAAVNARYVPSSAQPAKNPACGPSVAPLKA
jgi:hypothetical protein